MVDERYRALADELVAMAAVDLGATRAAVQQDDHAAQLAWRRVTTAHGDRLAEIMAEHGWPVARLVGTAAASAWKLAQHADRQLEVQRRALTLLAEAVAAGEASPRELALLHDRVLVNEGQEQIYGTQIAGVRDGTPVPWPCVDPEHLDERRADAGLEPFAVQVTRTEPAPDPWYEREPSVTE
ncbi:MAG: hypothetical protein QOI74_923 [Micromonosporaceae bacterium]|jgi:hypothetical protein|nr:hypothetical protein [Micromonosporaceae bacterium]